MSDKILVCGGCKNNVKKGKELMKCDFCSSTRCEECLNQCRSCDSVLCETHYQNYSSCKHCKHCIEFLGHCPKY